MAVAISSSGQWKEYDYEKYNLKSKIDYPLADYVNPDFHYRELLTVFTLNGLYDNLATRSTGKTTSNHLSFNPGGAITSYSLHNDSRFQRTASWRVNADFSLNNSNSNTNDSKTQTRQLFGGANLFYRTENRIYKGRFFWGYGIETGLNYRGGNNRQDNTSGSHLTEEQTSRDLSVAVAPRLLAGYGRLEQTSNAWQAVHLVRGLQRVNRLAKIPSTEEITVMADKMTHLRNQRGFDYRLKRMSDLIVLDSALRLAGLLSEADVVAFVAISDIWSYAPQPDRASGTRWFAGIEPSVAYIHNFNHLISVNFDLEKTESETTKGYNKQDYSLLAGVVSARPLNLEWQRDFTAELRVGYGNHLNSADQKTEFTPSAGFVSTLGYSYYPDTRTKLKAALKGWLNWYSVEYNQFFYGLATKTVSYDEIDAEAGATFELDRYLSPTLRINIRASVFYDHTQSDYHLSENQATYTPVLTYDKKIVMNAAATLVYQIK